MGGGIIGTAVGAFDTGRPLVEGFEGGAVQGERVHLVVVNGVLIATLLLTLLQYLARDEKRREGGG